MIQHSENPAVFISGAMSGIGKELALQYLKRGYNVAVFNRSLNPAVVAQLQSSTLNDSQKVVFHQVDIIDYDKLKEAMADAYEILGSAQLAINSAGVQRALPFLELTETDFSQVISVNLMGSRNFSYAAIQFMQPGARLVLISSLAGIIPNYSYTAYCASKFGVYGLAKALRLELREKRIEVSVVCPPVVDTPMIAEERRTAHPASLMLKRFAGTLELSPSVDYIMSKLDRNKFLIIPGFKANLVYLSDKFLPLWLNFWLVDSAVKYSARQTKKRETNQ